MSRNEHTGDKQQTKTPTEQFRNNYDLIFKKNKDKPCQDDAKVVTQP